MTRARLLILVASLVAVAAAAVLYARRDTSTPVEIVAAQAPATSPAPAAAGPAIVPTDAGATPPTATFRTRLPDPMAATFEATDDLLAFIEGIQDVAQSGDGPAAYYMYHALERCQTEYGRRFGSGRRERPLDEVLTDESIVSHFGVEDILRIHGQCQRLRESDIARFGPADDWLLKSADAGYPRAQAEAALWFVQTGGSAPNTDSSGQARGFARAALSSKDPEVFPAVSLAIEGLNREKTTKLPLDSWYVAACLRGLDCGPGAELTRTLCRAGTTCNPNESTLDLIRRLTGARFAEIERVAHEINDAIDAGRFEELGL